MLLGTSPTLGHVAYAGLVCCMNSHLHLSLFLTDLDLRSQTVALTPAYLARRLLRLRQGKDDRNSLVRERHMYALSVDCSN